MGGLKTKSMLQYGLGFPYDIDALFSLFLCLLSEKQQHVRELRECHLLVLCILEITVLHLMTLPCSERCSEARKVVSKNNNQGIPEIFFDKLKVVLSVLF